MNELSDCYLLSERTKPEVLECMGFATSRGECREYTVMVDLYNWKFAVKGLTEEMCRHLNTPEELVAEADSIGGQLLEQILGVVMPNAVGYHTLRSHPEGIRC